MTIFNTLVLIASALMAPEGIFIEESPIWKSIDERQAQFLDYLPELKKDCSSLSSDELKSWASENHEELNKVAVEQNIPITFTPFAHNEFGTLSVMALDLKWLKKPSTTPCMFKDQRSSVDALLFTSNFEVIYTDYYANPIVRIKTKSGDIICATIADEWGLKYFEDQITMIRQDIEDGNFERQDRDSEDSYNAVVIPQFEYEGFSDISWLNGMKCGTSAKNNEYAINQAVKYIKIRCDYNGCNIKAGTGLSFVPVSSGKGPLVIDEPFLFWVERPGCHFSLIEGLVDSDALIKA